MTEPTTVHHQTRRGADLALAKRLISRKSYDAVLAGEISLQRAKELGRSGTPTDTPDDRSGPASVTGTSGRVSPDAATDAPPQPTSRTSKSDRSRGCMCGCSRETKGRFAMGHDQVLLRYAYEYAKGERELNEEQLSYVRDETNKLQRARARVEREERKRKERIARKSERQRKREGEAEHKKQNASE